jgi:hypothetical protein
MRRLIYLALPVLAACGPAAEPLTLRSPAPAGALDCVQGAGAELGYEVANYGPADGVRLERQLKWTENTPFHRWNRIDASYSGSELQIDAGTLQRHAARELTGTLIAPAPELAADVEALGARCGIATAAAE